MPHPSIAVKALLALIAVMLLSTVATTAQARQGDGSATGLSVQGDGVLDADVTAAQVAETDSAPFEESETVLNLDALDGAVTADTVTASTRHEPFEHLVESDAATENLAIDLGIDLFGLVDLNLVTLSSDTIESAASVNGMCGDFSAEGSTGIENLTLSLLDQAVVADLTATPDPNTELANIVLDTTIAGVGIQATAIAILNEQDIAADESDISVNALRITITLTATLLAVELTQDLEIIVARSRAGFINCNTVDLEIAKTTDLGGENATVGEPFNYTVTITNSDAVNEATAVAFTDQLPAEVDFDAFGTITGGGDCEYDADNHTIICQWLTIPADTSVSATYQVTPNTATAPDAASNIAVVTTGDEDPEPDNNSASVDVIIEPTENQADLAIEKDVSATEVTVGEEFSYTLTVTNNGPDTAILVVVTDTLPAQVQFVSATPEGACTETAGVVSCELGNLADQEEVIIVLTVLAVSAGTASNTATVDAASTDPNPDDNTAGPVDTTIQPPPDLSVTLAGPTTGVVGDPAEYTATVTNNLDETVEDVELVIEIPDGMSLDEGSVSATGGGICTIASITCNWDSIAGDGSVVVSFTLIPNMVGPQLLEATVGTEADGDLDSDQLTISILAATGRGDPRAIPTLSFYGMLVFLLLLGFLVLRGGRVNHR